jgi:hypothetical protein
MQLISHETVLIMIMAVSIAGEAQAGNGSIRGWCIFGACLGAFCSLHFCRIKKTKTLREDIAWQFTVNLILSGVFSPFLVPTLADWSKQSPTDIAVATGLAVGMIAQKFVKDYALPFARSWAQWRRDQIAVQLGINNATGKTKAHQAKANEASSEAAN